MPDRPTEAAAPSTSKAPAKRPSRAKKPADPGERARKFAVEAARLLADDKCENVVILDVRDKSQVTDFVVIGSGTSDRQMRAVLSHVRKLGEELGHTAFRTDADDRATWLLADFADVMVHVFEPNTRAHYDLEMMWGDAPRVTWARRARAGAKAKPGAEPADDADAE